MKNIYDSSERRTYSLRFLGLFCLCLGLFIGVVNREFGFFALCVISIYLILYCIWDTRYLE